MYRLQRESPHTREFRAILRRIANIPDWVAERVEFELTGDLFSGL